MPKIADPKVPHVEVELLKDHVHDGVDYAPGDKIAVDLPTAQWLADNAIVKALEDEQPAPPLPAEQTTHSPSNE